ncbi:MAG: cytochrome c biogenesis CcdA family protein [Georgenia sp.]
MWEEIADTFARTVLDGSMLAALPVAALAGLISFASPCVLPLLPGYVGYLGGMVGASAGVGPGGGGSRTVSGTGALGRTRAATGSGALGRTRATTGTRARTGTGAPNSGRLLLGVLLFVAGFTAVFLLLGVMFSLAGIALRAHLDLIMRVMGVVVIVMGLAFMGALPALQRERRPHMAPRYGLWGAPVLGAVFGLGWAPCIGPTLAAVLSLSFGGADPTRGALLVVAYCLGLGVPFVVLAMLFSRSSRALSFLRRHRRTLQVTGGGLLVLLGGALVTGVWGTITNQLQGLIDGFVTVV